MPVHLSGFVAALEILILKSSVYNLANPPCNLMILTLVLVDINSFE